MAKMQTQTSWKHSLVRNAEGQRPAGRQDQHINPNRRFHRLKMSLWRSVGSTVTQQMRSLLSRYWIDIRQGFPKLQDSGEFHTRLLQHKNLQIEIFYLLIHFIIYFFMIIIIVTNLQANSFHQRRSWVWWAFWLFLAQEGKDGAILWCTLSCMEFYQDPPFGWKKNPTMYTNIGDCQ